MGQVTEAERDSAEVFEALVDGLGRAVAAPGVIEEREDIGGPALERGAERC